MKSAVYQSRSTVAGAPAYAERSGQVVQIIRPLSARTGPVDNRMYRIRFADGQEADAFSSELVRATTSEN